LKLPHFSISTLMALVALVALDFGVVRTLFDYQFVPRDVCDLLTFGILPMANVLALGLFPFLTRSGRAVSRPRWIGFEVFGAAGLALLLSCCLLATEPIHAGVPRLLWFLSPGWLFLVGASLLMLSPPMALALLGAWIAGKSETRAKESLKIQDAPDWKSFP
jgi:hypothetical protein